MKNIKNLVLMCLLMLIVITTFPGEGTVAEEYEDTPSQTKTVEITNVTQTDTGFELFTVDKWGKLVSNFTWDGESEDDLDVSVNFWTIGLQEANQADYGDLGFENLRSYTTFPKIASHKCQLYWVDDDQLPVTIYYEIDKTKNPDHEIESGTTLTLVVTYYNLMGEEATRGTPAVSLPIILMALVIFVVVQRRKPMK